MGGLTNDRGCAPLHGGAGGLASYKTRVFALALYPPGCWAPHYPKTPRKSARRFSYEHRTTAKGPTISQDG